MSELAIVRLPAKAEQEVYWHIEDVTSHEVIASGVVNGLVNLHELKTQIGDRRIVALAAASAMSVHALNLPAKSRKQARQVVPFALEDEVAQDIDDLHFAWPHSSSPQIALPVVAIAKAQMELWLRALMSAGMNASAIYPDVFALPWEAGTWSAAQFGSEYVVRTDSFQGMTIEPEWFAVGALESDELPGIIHSFGEVNWESPPIPVQETSYDLALAAMLSEIELHGQSMINLLQGDYRQTEKKSFDHSFIKFPAIAASVCLGCYLILQGATIWSLNSETNAYNDSALATFQDISPNISQLPPNARAQVDRQLAALTGGGESGFLTLMNSVAPAFSQVNMTLNVLQFEQSNQELRIQAVAEDFQSFERFQAALRAQQLEVEQGQLVNRGGQVSGALTIRRGS